MYISTFIYSPKLHAPQMCPLKPTSKPQHEHGQTHSDDQQTSRRQAQNDWKVLRKGFKNYQYMHCTQHNVYIEYSVHTVYIVYIAYIVCVICHSIMLHNVYNTWNAYFDTICTKHQILNTMHTLYTMKAHLHILPTLYASRNCAHCT